MSDAIMRKSFTVVCVRTTGEERELETVPDFNAAVNTAKEALTNKKNSEVRVVENNYDSATRKDKKQVVKIFVAETSRSSGSHGSGARRKPGHSNTPRPMSREVANKASKSIAYLVMAATVMVVLIAIIVTLVD